MLVLEDACDGVKSAQPGVHISEPVALEQGDVCLPLTCQWELMALCGKWTVRGKCSENPTIPLNVLAT